MKTAPSPSPGHTISVAIVEDDTDIAGEIATIIAATPDMTVCCACANARTALVRIPPLAPDVVLMDINLPDGSGIGVTAKLKRLLPRTQVMIFTIYEDAAEIFSALKAGASGYLLKRAPPAALHDAIRDIMRGGVPMSGIVARKIISHFQEDRVAFSDDNARLTPRETEILDLLAQGFSSKEIAARAFIGIQTVNTHLQHIYDKLHVRSRTEAVLKYMNKPAV
jgi:DNA-binding NarL/FixJ family response regulator